MTRQFNTHPRTTTARKTVNRLVVAGAIAGGLASATPASAASPKSIASIEHTTEAKLNAHKFILSANGKLTYTAIDTNPYTGEKKTVSNTITNPLVASIGGAAIGPTGNKLTKAGKFAFGYEDSVNPETTVHFLKFDPKTMHFTPNNHGNQVRPVTFNSMDGVLDYTKPLGAAGVPYQNELFGAMAPTGTTPTVIRPQL